MTRSLLTNFFEDLDEYYTSMSKCNSRNCCSTQTNRGITISEDSQNIYIDAPVPGANSEDVDVTFDPKSRHLIIRGESKLSRENVKYHLKGQNCFCYEIPLSNEIEIDPKIDAVCKNGILSLTLPKSQSNKPLKIDVKVA